MIKIRNAELADLDQIMVIYKRASAYMAKTGNPNQWVNGYPKRELIASDIKRQVSFVAEENGRIEGVFSFIFGEDPTYQKIEQGAWICDGEYATIHRLASAGTMNGIAAECFIWCADQCKNIRADTHHDNRIMQHLLEKNNFVRCGIIYLSTGAPRIAYQRVSNQSE